MIVNLDYIVVPLFLFILQHKMNRPLLDKNLHTFPKNSKFSLEILMITLKIDVVFCHTAFQILSESTFS